MYKLRNRVGDHAVKTKKNNEVMTYEFKIGRMFSSHRYIITLLLDLLLDINF